MIVGPTRSWSYAELHVHTEAVVGALRREGLGLGDRAILAAEACPEAIAVILACSMLGVVFVPTTPDLPTARLRAIAETTSAALVITSNDAELDLDALDATEVQPGTLERLVIGRRRSASPRGAAGAKPLGSDLAYIIFTSGTTGRPKGIMMSHGAAVTFFRGLVEHAAIGPGERIGSIAPLSFDFSLLDMGLALGVGATLVQVPRALPHAPRRLVEYLDHHEVSMMNCVPSVWRLVVQHAADALSGLAGRLHSTLVAGEGFPMPYLRRLREALPSLRIINCFGQSESIASSFADVPLPLAPDAEHISIGRPHRYAEMLLIDDEGRPVDEPGRTGEIFLRGPTLFHGYWGDPQATQAALVPNPLRPELPERVFRTGDRAHRGPDGMFHYVGRRDSQVKVRGNRVELEEVERCLCSHRAVEQAVVCFDDQQLAAAFVVSAGYPTPTAADLIEHCATYLPRYMIPTRFQRLDALPHGSQGKLDRMSIRRLLGVAGQ